ncbi:hypothetical protein SPI_00712 [Niveomyces insectorum RCEF 264]|uniref:Uncharacterized protein n=1 Tax=Niveomyces insectorum RCEF 264 TaxID=1081102 RepID=A0A168ABF7_9HYPO|nr:hypothetical protein SPI_00712 [Niveomyces insectorum RCEF 264]
MTHNNETKAGSHPSNQPLSAKGAVDGMGKTVDASTVVNSTDHPTTQSDSSMLDSWLQEQNCANLAISEALHAKYQPGPC